MNAGLSAGDTAWVLLCSALVLLMTVGLALFYGGLVRPKNALNTMMMSVIALGLVGVQWVVAGYSLAFHTGGGWLGGVGLGGLGGGGVAAGPPHPAPVPPPAHTAVPGVFPGLHPARAFRGRGPRPPVRAG